MPSNKLAVEAMFQSHEMNNENPYSEENRTKAIETGAWRCCLTCENVRSTWEVKGQTHITGCDIANGLIPPAEIQLRGCPSWELGIPF